MNQAFKPSMRIINLRNLRNLWFILRGDFAVWQITSISKNCSAIWQFAYRFTKSIYGESR